MAAEREEDILVSTARQVEDLINADFCTVFLVDDEKQTLWSTSTDKSGGELQGVLCSRIALTPYSVGPIVAETRVIATAPDERIVLEPTMDTTSGYCFQRGEVLVVDN
eukprot:2531621-Rhodomonas_salina.7